jgi:hypothetical protein
MNSEVLMRVFAKPAILVCLVVLSGISCTGIRPEPLKPRKPLASGTLMFQFTKSVQGPVDLSIDGVRIPVEDTTKKSALRLVISGLAVGKHRYALTSARDAFGPGQGEFDMPGDKGVFVATYSQRLNSVLYGKPEAMPPAEGLPGVKAKLER